MSTLNAARNKKSPPAVFFSKPKKRGLEKNALPPPMSIRVGRPPSLETAPYRPLVFEVGAEYYHAESTTRDTNLEFWANPNDLKFVGVFVEEVLDGAVFRGAVFRLPTGDHLVRYNSSGTSCFKRGPIECARGSLS